MTRTLKTRAPLRTVELVCLRTIRDERKSIDHSNGLAIAE